MSSTTTSRPARSVGSRAVHPARLVAAGFAAAIGVGTLLLLLPIAGQDTTWSAALFTATSAVCVTGLAVVDTPTHWSGFGQVVILGLIQVGGLGIMTLSSLFALLVTRRLGLRTRLTAATETKTVGLGDVRSVLFGVVKMSLVIEAVTAAAVTARFVVGYDESLPRALWLGVFHAVSAFNNAGFALFSDSLIGFVADPWICVPLCIAVVLGGLGFPVIFELLRGTRPSRWSLHTSITVVFSAALLVAGVVLMAVEEWSSPATLGPLDTPGKVLAAVTASVMARTAGFNSVDIGAMSPASLLGTDALMFVGGGAAGTAGGIKVTTFAVLLFVIAAEVRGAQDVQAFDRRIDRRAQRQALAATALSLLILAVAVFSLLRITSLSTDQVLFESVSAFATVGLSTGITADLPLAGQLILIALMFLGRVGPVALVSAMALRERTQLYRLPEARPLIG